MKRNISLSFLASLPAFFLLFSFGCAGNKIVDRADNQTVSSVVDRGIKNSDGGTKKPVNILQEFGIEDGSQFTPEELSVLALFREAKNFVKEKLGFKETQNFKRFDKTIKMTRIYFHLKRGPFPFSDQDCRYMSLVRKKYGKDEAGELAWLAGRGITRDKYDIWLYFPSAVSGDMPVHQALLKRSPFNIVGLVAHEDWHMTVGLPLHLEEASAALIEIAAPVLFGYSRERSLKEFARWSKCVVAINLCHKEISAMAVQLENKEITYEQYLARREQCVRVAEKSQDCYPELNPTKVAHLHTYTYYFPLLYRLYNACGCDLLKFIEVLKEMDKHGNFTTPRSFISKEQFFLGWREAEMQAEAYLENVIKILSVDKSK